MKTFILVRHAKSSWDYPELSDKERPLNNRGKRDAPRMAALLKDLYPDLETFYSSPAKRAHTTALEFVSAYNIDPHSISIETDLYFGDESDIMDIVNNAPNNIDTLAIFSHNPTSTYFINGFEGGAIDNLPTCGVAIFKSTAQAWNAVNTQNTLVSKILKPKVDL